MLTRRSDNRLPRRRHDDRLAAIRLAAGGAVVAAGWCISGGAATPAHGATSAEWVTPTSGNWTDPAKWSTAPLYPNNGTPAGANYEATIAAAGGGSPYTVTLANSVTLDRLTIDAADATLNHEYLGAPTVLTINGPLDLRSGTFRGRNGTLANATIAGTGGNFQLTSYVLDRVTLDRALVAGDVTIRNGVTLTDNGELVAGRVSFYGAQTIAGTGTVVLDGEVNEYGELLINPGVTVTTDPTGFGGSIVPYQYIADSTLANRGTIWARTPDRMLNIDVKWRNTGVMKVSDGSILGLGGEFTIPAIGTIQNLGGAVRITGTLTNFSTTLALNESTGSWQLGGGTIMRGTLTTADGVALRTGYSSIQASVLDKVNVQGQVMVDGWTSLRNGTTFAAAPLIINAGGQLEVDQPTLAGPLDVVFEGSDPNHRGVIFSGRSKTLTIAPGVVVRTGASSGHLQGAASPGWPGGNVVNQGLISARTPGESITFGSYYVNDGSFVTNQGTLEAINGAALIVQGNWSNAAGVIRVNTGGRLTLGGAVASSELGTIENPDAVPITVTGAIKNQNSTLAITPAMGSLELEGGSANITGGTVTTSGGARLILRSAPAASGYHLDGVTLAGEMTVVGGASHAPFRVANGLHLDHGTISFQPAPSSGGVLWLYDAGGATNGLISGNGQIRFDGAGGNLFTIVNPLVIPSGITVRTGLGSGSLGGNGSFGGNVVAGVTNQGLISAETPDTSITVYKLVNQGTARAINGGTLALLGAWSNTGSLVVDDGTLNLGGSFATADMGTVSRSGAGSAIVLSGVMNNNGATLTLDTTLGSFQMSGATISGGTIATADGQALIPVSGNNAISGAVLTGRMDMLGGTANFTSTLAAGGVINVSGGQLNLNPGWSNQGTINLSGGVVQLGGTYTLPAAMTNIVRSGGGETCLGGTADNAGNTLTVDAASGPMRLAGTLNGGDIRTRDGAVLHVAHGTLNNVATLDGTIAVLPATNLSVNGGLTMVDGRIVLPMSTTQFASTLTIGSTLGGSGEVVFEKPSDSSTRAAMLRTPFGSPEPATIGADITVRTGSGSGIVGSGFGASIINQGTISSQTAGQQIAFAGTFTNHGRIEARNGGLLVASSGFNNAAGGVIDVDAQSAFTATGTATLSGGSVGGAGPVRFNSANITGDVIKQGPGTMHIAATLTLAAETKLDLTDSKLIVNAGNVGTFSGGSYTGLTGLIASAYNFGEWSGAGITTSMPDAGPTVGRTTLGIGNAEDTFYAGGTFGGISVDSNDALIMYTWAGDVDLSGYVDAVDYGTIDNWIQFPGTSGYGNGDLNYDGVIDAVDYGIIDNGIQLQGPPMPTNAAATPPALSAMTAVPEPAGGAVMVVALGIVAAGARQRRRRRP